MIGHKIEKCVLDELESLRKQGLSVKAISTRLNISKSTASKYCKNVKLPENAIIKLKNNIRNNAISSSMKIKEKRILFQDKLEAEVLSVVDLNQNVDTLIKQLCIFGLTQKRIAKILNITSGAVEYSLLKEISKQNRIKRISNIRKKIKNKLVLYSGGKCVKCGYDKCISSLAFHHIDPNEKEFTISQAKHRNYDKYKAECDKCLLLCHNCHGEFHEGLWEISNDLILKQNQIRLEYNGQIIRDIQ